jgi:hypothetical protein
VGVEGRGLVEESQEGGTLFSNGVFGFLRKLWGQEDMVDNEVQTLG